MTKKKKKEKRIIRRYFCYEVSLDVYLDVNIIIKCETKIYIPATAVDSVYIRPEERMYM